MISSIATPLWRAVPGALALLLAASCGLPGPAEMKERAAARRAAAQDRRERAEAKELAEEMAAGMDVPLLAAQVLMTGVDGAFSPSGDTRALLSDIPVGAVMLFRYNLSGGAEGIRAFIAGCAEPLRIPPFIALDHEGGLVHRLGADATRLPSQAAFGRYADRLGMPEALRTVEEAAYLSGRELRNLGFSMNLAPVAETLDDENRVFLDTRSFGTDGKLAGEASAAFIRGMAKAGIASAVKHFPGNAAADPHHAAARLDWDAEKLEAALKPFHTVFSKAESAAVMVSHAVLPAVDPAVPGSLSPALMTGLLKKRMGYDGIVLADDFRMAAVAATGRTPEGAAVEALAAGADMVMTWQKDLRRLHAALVAAVEEGALPRARLRDAAARVIYAKIRSGVVTENSAPPQTGAATDLETMKKETENFLRERGLR